MLFSSGIRPPPSFWPRTPLADRLHPCPHSVLSWSDGLPSSRSSSWKIHETTSDNMHLLVAVSKGHRSLACMPDIKLHLREATNAIITTDYIQVRIDWRKKGGRSEAKNSCKKNLMGPHEAEAKQRNWQHTVIRQHLCVHKPGSFLNTVEGSGWVLYTWHLQVCIQGPGYGLNSRSPIHLDGSGLCQRVSVGVC